MRKSPKKKKKKQLLYQQSIFPDYYHHDMSNRYERELTRELRSVGRLTVSSRPVDSTQGPLHQVTGDIRGCTVRAFAESIKLTAD